MHQPQGMGGYLCRTMLELLKFFGESHLVKIGEVISVRGCYSTGILGSAKNLGSAPGGDFRVFATLSSYRFRKDLSYGSETFVDLRRGHTMLNNKR